MAMQTLVALGIQGQPACQPFSIVQAVEVQERKEMIARQQSLRTAETGSRLILTEIITIGRVVVLDRRPLLLLRGMVVKAVVAVDHLIVDNQVI
jgi:hypothetical protein